MEIPLGIFLFEFSNIRSQKSDRSYNLIFQLPPDTRLDQLTLERNKDVAEVLQELQKLKK